MSPSEPAPAPPSLDSLTEQIDRATATLPLPGEGADPPVSNETLNVLIAAVARLYASQVENTGETTLDDRTGTTEAVVLACALIKAHDLNPFDLALWFSRG